MENREGIRFTRVRGNGKQKEIGVKAIQYRNSTYLQDPSPYAKDERSSSILCPSAHISTVIEKFNPPPIITATILNVLKD